MAFIIGDDNESELMMISAFIRSNLGQDTEGMNEAQFEEASCKAVWLESFRLRNQAEMLVEVFGGKKK